MWARPLVLQILLSIAVLLAVFAALPRATYAQTPQQNALARALFDEGVQLADRSDWVGAADRFSRAYSLKPTSGIAFNWAHVLVEQGKLVHAQDLLVGVLRDPAADTALKLESQSALSAITPRLAKLEVHITGAIDEHTALHVDDVAWPRAAWDVASPVDPGAHTVELHSSGEPMHIDVTLAEGELRALTLEAPAKVIAPVEAPIAPATPIAVETHDDKPLYKNWMLWTGVGVVVVAGVVTGAVLATHHGDKNASPVAGNANPGVLRW